MRAVAAPASALVTKLHRFLWTAQLYFPHKPYYFLALRSVELGVFSHVHKMLEQKRWYSFIDKNQDGPGNLRMVGVSMSLCPRPTLSHCHCSSSDSLSRVPPRPPWGGSSCEASFSQGSWCCWVYPADPLPHPGQQTQLFYRIFHVSCPADAQDSTWSALPRRLRRAFRKYWLVMSQHGQTQPRKQPCVLGTAVQCWGVCQASLSAWGRGGERTWCFLHVSALFPLLLPYLGFNKCFQNS